MEILLIRHLEAAATNNLDEKGPFTSRVRTGSPRVDLRRASRRTSQYVCGGRAACKQPDRGVRTLESGGVHVNSPHWWVCRCAWHGQDALGDRLSTWRFCRCCWVVPCDGFGTALSQHYCIYIAPRYLAARYLKLYSLLLAIKWIRSTPYIAIDSLNLHLCRNV